VIHKLSIVIITLNEERNIEKCLQAAAPVADDIVVYDSFSTDATCEIAKKYGARVFQGKWQGYSATKNEANKKAQYDWILSLDADEVLSKPLQGDLLKVKASGLKTAAFKRLTNYCGKWIKHAGWYPDIKLRLFNRNEMQWEGLIHEELKAINGHHQTPYLLDGDCLHYSYYSIAEHLRQTEKFSQLSARHLYEKGARVSVLKVWFAPLFKFVQMYFLKLGLLDGYYGLMLCKISAEATYQKYAGLRALCKRQ
jgi:glycosyltransferase involved in cell wall biosynthesis